MCFVWISEQTAIISLYNINWLVCITVTESVYWAVRTGSLNQTDSLSSFRGYHRSIHKHTARNPPTRTTQPLVHPAAAPYAQLTTAPFTAHKQTPKWKARPSLPTPIFRELTQMSNSTMRKPSRTESHPIWPWLWPVWAVIHLRPSVTCDCLHTDLHTTQRQLDVLYITHLPLFMKILLFSLMFVWPCILNMKWFVRPTWFNNYDLLINQ